MLSSGRSLMVMMFMMVTTTGSLCFVLLGTELCFGGTSGLVVVGMSACMSVCMSMSMGMGMCLAGSRRNLPFRGLDVGIRTRLGLVRRFLVFVVVFLLVIFVLVVCSAYTFGSDAWFFVSFDGDFEYRMVTKLT